MYFNPFWSHAHSAFVAALFLWYWDRTRPNRTLGQWFLLGLISGLLVDVYFVNGVFLLIPLVESILIYVRDLRSKDGAAALHRFGENVLYLAAFGIMILPTLITRQIVYGGMLQFGAYTVLPWNWRAPFWRSVLFSSDHGMLSWTPLIGFALLGLFLPFPGAGRIRAYIALAAVAFFYVISSYPYWDGLASYGNRFFISLTPVFVFGLAILLERVGGLFRSFRFAYATQGCAIGLFALWNLAFLFQWGTHMIPARGRISWGAMVHNQFAEVPRQMTAEPGKLFPAPRRNDAEYRAGRHRAAKTGKDSGKVANSMSATQTQAAVAASPLESPVVRIEARRGWLALDRWRIVGLPRSGLFFYLARHQGSL
jgi:hypothetical protein